MSARILILSHSRVDLKRFEKNFVKKNEIKIIKKLRVSSRGCAWVNPLYV